MARTIEVEVHESCGGCGEPLGIGTLQDREIRCEGVGDPFPVVLRPGDRLEVCPFCRTLRPARENEPRPGPPHGSDAADACLTCGAGAATSEVRGAWTVALEETTALLEVRGDGGASVCPQCRTVRLREGAMELRGLEVALQKGGVRRSFGIALWRGFLVGAVIGAAAGLLTWEWRDAGDFAQVAAGGALVGCGLGATLGALGSLGWSLLRGEGRERLS